MDRVEFRVRGESVGEGRSVRTIHPVVNGTMLADLARPVEVREAVGRKERKLAGAYVGLGDPAVRWPSRHYLGEPVLRWFEDGDTVLLGCECGEWGCWPLTAKVEVRAEVVVWSDFRNGHRDWDLSELGPFTFDRGQYVAALAATGPAFA